MLELADPHPVRARERAGLVPEQLALGERLGQPAAVQRHEVQAAALAVVVQAARDELLAGSGLAIDQDVRRGPASVITVRRTFCICASGDQQRLDAVPVLECIVQAAHLQRELAALDRMADDGDQPPELKGFSMKS